MAVVVTTVASPPSGATTLYVDKWGGGEYRTIGEALDAAESGDEILVAPGFYWLSEALEFGQRVLTLRSILGPDHTTIGGPEGDHCILVEGPDPVNGTSRIEGFTIRDAQALYGAGIRCDDCALDIVDCSFEDCIAFAGDHHWSDGKGGGLFSRRSTVSVTDCAFVGNVALSRGGGIYSEESYLTVSGCRFENNSEFLYGTGCEGVAVATTGYSVSISDCEFIGNQGQDGAAVRGWGFVEMQNCTVAHNSTDEDGSALNIGIGIIERCVVAFTEPGRGVACDQRTTFTKCVVFGNAAGDSLCSNYSDNLFVEPLMCDSEVGDLGLCADSPCLPEGNAWGVLVGANGQVCGPCDTATEPRSWTSIKAMFR